MKQILRYVVGIGMAMFLGFPFVTFTTQPSVRAQEGGQERITLSPAVVQPEFNKGQTATGKLTIINDGQVGYDFLVYARPFSVEGEVYAANYTEVNERTEAYQWVQFNQSKYFLEPGKSVEIPYTVRVPAGVAGGGHYAVLFAETQPKPITGGAGVARKKRVGALMYMTVEGEIRRSGSLESWDVPLYQSKKPVSSMLRMKNDGNVHYQIDLQASYSNIFGKKQFTLNQQLLVLPGTTRRIPVEWQNAPYLGIFKATGKISYLGKTETLPNKYIILIPSMVWFIAIGVAVIVLIGWFLKHRKRSKRSSVRRR